MSTSLLAILEHEGYDIENSKDDANWLLSIQSEFDELVELAEETIERIEEEEREAEDDE